MSTFEIELRDIRIEPIDRTFHPEQAELDELFEAVAEDFRIDDPDGFVAHLRVQMSDPHTVHVSGRVEGTFEYTCGRCLQERQFEFDKDVNFVLMSRSEWANAYEEDDEIALDEADLDVSYFEGESIDVAELIREAFIVDLPSWPHCTEELREMCDAAYEKHVGDDTLEHLDEMKIDLRWTPLKEIELSDDSEGTEEPQETD